MEAAQWEHVHEIFSRLVDLPRDQQSATLAEACGGDPAVEREVLELLHEDAAGRACSMPILA